MELMIRGLFYLAVGCLLVLANLWFITSIRRTFHPTEYVLAPFQVLTEDAAEEDYGTTLARMLAVRLASLQRDLASAREVGEAPPPGPDQDAARAAVDEPTATLLILPQPVDVPTQLLQPVDIEVSVGGVEVGGLVPWIQRAVSRDRTLTFTVADEGELVRVSADLSGFADGPDAYLWFKSSPLASEIVTNVAYGLVQKRIAGGQDSPLGSLDHREFRKLVQSVIEVERLNQKVRRGQVVSAEFAGILPDLEEIGTRLPEWHELTYLIANVADSAGNRQKTGEYAGKLANADPSAEEAPPAELVRWALESLERWGLPAPVDEAERHFVRVAHDFARRMNLPGTDPPIVFETPEHSAVQAMWNQDSATYLVNPQAIDTPGLPQYVALMGRFMEKNYARCFDAGPSPPVEFWNGFRYAVVDYLIQSVPEFGDLQLMSGYPQNRNLFESLKRLEGGDPEPVRRLALALLERFDCDWTFANLKEKVLAINDEGGFMPRERIEADFRPEPGRA